MSRVLIVDDIYEIRMMMRSLLARRGYTVLDAKDGREALSIIEKDPPDLIITDILMPGMDGFDTIIDLRDNNYNMPIIIVSGYTDYISKNLAERLGVTSILSKPFLPEEMLNAVEDALRRDRDLVPSYP